MGAAEVPWGAAGMAGEELPEVGGFREAEAAGDECDRCIGVRRQPLGLQGDPCVDDLLDGLAGGGQAGAGEGLDGVAQAPCVVLGAACAGVGAFELGAEAGVDLADGVLVACLAGLRQAVDVQQQGGELELEDLLRR